MSETIKHLVVRARECRERARHARRLSLDAWPEDDVSRLLRYAERQDAAASRLEHEAGAARESGRAVDGAAHRTAFPELRHWPQTDPAR